MIPDTHSRAEVLTAFHISERHLRQLIADRRVGYLKAGREKRFTDEHVQQITAALEVRPQAVDLRAIGVTSRGGRRRAS